MSISLVSCDVIFHSHFVLVVGSRPSDHYFRSVCWFVCLFVCAEFFSAVFDPISIKLDICYMSGSILVSLECRGCATPGGWVTPKNLYFGAQKTISSYSFDRIVLIDFW